MNTEENRPIDWQIVSLDGGLFRRGAIGSSEPLIDVHAVATAPSPAIREAPATSRTITPRPAAPRHPRRLTAAGVAVGVLLTSLCAMAFQGSISEPARLAEATPPAPPGLATPDGEPLAGGTSSDEAVFATTSHDDAATAASAPSAPVPTQRNLQAPAALAPVVAPRGLPLEAQVPPGSLAALAAPAADIDRSSAALAFALAGRGASGCIDAGDTRRSVPVSVTYAPSGRVTSARVDGGPFLGTQAGSCIAHALRSATVHPFQGSPVIIHGSVHLK